LAAHYFFIQWLAALRCSFACWSVPDASQAALPAGVLLRLVYVRVGANVETREEGIHLRGKFGEPSRGAEQSGGVEIDLFGSQDVTSEQGTSAFHARA